MMVAGASPALAGAVRLLLPLAVGAVLVAAAGSASAQACRDWGKPGKLLHADAFDKGLGNWFAEHKPVAGSSIEAANGKLVMDLAGDATLWFKPRLSGNIRISYKRKVLMDGGVNDRLSDMNQFWMATDPKNKKNLFTRDGTFAQYDALSLYYMGMGGNTNSTTRFRKYDGTGNRILLMDLTEKPQLLKPNHEYDLVIDVYKGCTRMLVDGEEYFDYRDAKPLRSGYFGFRTTHSRQEITNFQVRELR